MATWRRLHTHRTASPEGSKLNVALSHPARPGGRCATRRDLREDCGVDLQGALVNKADRGWSPSRQGVCRGLWVGGAWVFFWFLSP